MERRAYERFQLALPTRVELILSGGGQVFEAQTRDISAKGAFLNTREALPEGTGVWLELTIENERIRELTGTQGVIRVEGTVVRSTPEGIAVHFDGETYILNLGARDHKCGEGLIALVSCSLVVVGRLTSILWNS
jgi:hypothetical protein